MDHMFPTRHALCMRPSMSNHFIEILATRAFVRRNCSRYRHICSRYQRTWGDYAIPATGDCTYDHVQILMETSFNIGVHLYAVVTWYIHTRMWASIRLLYSIKHVSHYIFYICGRICYCNLKSIDYFCLFNIFQLYLVLSLKYYSLRVLYGNNMYLVFLWYFILLYCEILNFAIILFVRVSFNNNWYNQMT